MTISSTTRTAGPYTGTGLVGTYPFLFKVMNANEVSAYTVSSTSVETTLVYGINYSVTLNANQDASPGGFITLLPVGTKLAAGTSLVLTSSAPNLQLLDLTNQGGFYPDTINDALDRATIQIQQLQTQLDRTVKTQVTDTVTPDELLASIKTSELSAATSANAALSTYNTFRGTYYGALAGDPTVDPLGNLPTQGDFYFNTTNQVCRAKTSTAWADVGAATPVTIRVQRFSGNDTTVAFTLTNAASFENACEIFINGVAQVPGVDYTLAQNPGTQLLTDITFTTAPPTGTNNIYVRTTNAVSGQTVNDGSITTGKLASLAVTGAKIADATITPAKLTQDNAMKNKIINGNMLVGQRGTSFAVTATSTYTVDRWAAFFIGTMAATVSREPSDTPANNLFPASLKATVTTAQSTLNADSTYSMYQLIEGYNILDLIGNTFTLSFWVKASVAGTYSVSLCNLNGQASNMISYTIATANNWEYKTLTFTNGLSGSVTGGWNKTNGMGLAVRFILAAGSQYVTTNTNAWQNSNFLAVSGQVNIFATAGNTFSFTGVQLERGSNASAFEIRSTGLEVMLCQRYWQYATYLWSGYCTSGLNYYSNIDFPVPMRSTPSITFSSVNSLIGFPNTGATYTPIGNNWGIAYKQANSTQQAGYFVESCILNAEL